MGTYVKLYKTYISVLSTRWSQNGRMTSKGENTHSLGRRRPGPPGGTQTKRGGNNAAGAKYEQNHEEI
jgi:hypothetical protein